MRTRAAASRKCCVSWWPRRPRRLVLEALVSPNGAAVLDQETVTALGDLE
jgi:hypothetical protein